MESENYEARKLGSTTALCPRTMKIGANEGVIAPTHFIRNTNTRAVNPSRILGKLMTTIDSISIAVAATVFGD